MLPFITEDLRDILHNLMSRFIKESVLTAANTACKLANVAVGEEENWLPIDMDDPGFAGKRLLEQAVKSKAVSPLGKKEFLAAWEKLYSAMTQTIVERCPLKFSLVRGLQELDPRFMIFHKRSAEEKLRGIPNKLVGTTSGDRTASVMRCCIISKNYCHCSSDILGWSVRTLH